MPENSWPKSEELFRGHRDEFGEMIYIPVAVRLFGQHCCEMYLPLRRDIYDTYREDEAMLKSYLETLALNRMRDQMSVTLVKPRG